MHHYFAYGLTIASEIALPGMVECAAGDVVDLTIAEGPVDPDAIPGDNFRNWRAEPGRLFLELFGEGRMLVEHGKRITFERTAADEGLHLVSTIMGTGLAAILLQREILPIHSCCVNTGNGAVIVMGKSGAGKSTTLTGLLDAGCTMMVDDVTGVRVGEGSAPIAIPAFPSVRVWQDVLERSGTDFSALDRVRPDMAKYYVPVEDFHGQPEPLAGIIYMVAGNGSEPSVTQLDPTQRIAPLRQMVYRKNFLKSFGLEAFAFRAVAASARDVPMVRYERPTTPIPPIDVARQALAALGI